jgi:hypothetical protein
VLQTTAEFDTDRDTHTIGRSDVRSRIPLGWKLILIALAITVVSNTIDDRTTRLILSGIAAVIAVYGAVITWRTRRRSTSTRR